ncbi:MAG: gamma-glutamyltransferase [Candidatus Sericytochromatia bacterium]|nr:gamma-glutamyltransferase [Candidatus Sericytochromatia bacterium]
MVIRYTQSDTLRRRPVRFAIALWTFLLAFPCTAAPPVMDGVARPRDDVTAVESASAPLMLSSLRPSTFSTPGYRQQASPPPRVPYEPHWAYRSPQPAVMTRHGAVASVSSLASRVGVEILKQGGNAVDAAVAVAFALAVVFPEAGNVGGGGFMLIQPRKGQPQALDYRETAPERASARMFLDRVGNLTNRSVSGVLAAGVPGTVAGLEEAHRRFGQLPWPSLLAPAVHLARDGFVVDAYLASSFHRSQDLLLRFPETRRVFLPGGLTPRTGTLFRQPDLARTLALIAQKGGRGFYTGSVAQAVARDVARQGGILTERDLRNYRPRWREPIRFDYRGNTVVTMPLPSGGGLTLAQMMQILEGYDLKALGWHSAAHLHFFLEASRRAFADRNALLADPDFVADQPVADLLSKRYARQRRSSILPGKATPVFGRASGIEEKEQTTHFSVVDAQGMAVSNTYTLNGNFGCGVVAAGTGVLLNNEMDDFTVKPRGANQFGLQQGDRNRIEPGKRPLSSMTPAFVFDQNARLKGVLGSPGGPTIISSVAQVLSNVLDFGLPLNWAVASPRLHHQAQPDLLYFEPAGLDTVTRTELVRCGHQLQARDYIGDVHAIWRRSDGSWEAFSDPRRGGQALGY